MSKIFKGFELAGYMRSEVEEMIDEALQEIRGYNKDKAINFRVSEAHYVSVEDIVSKCNEYKTMSDYMIKALEEKLRASYLEILSGEM